MIKKIISCIALLCIALSVTGVCLGANEETQTAPTEENIQIPQGEMGQMPGGRGGMRGGRPMPNGEMPQFPQGEMPQMPEGEMPEMPEGEIPEMPQNEMPQNQVPQEGGGFGGRGQFGGRQFEDAFNPNENVNTAQDAVTQEQEINFFKKYFTPILSVILLAFAFIFVIFYKRKTY